jgi:hypothetical protein
MITIEYLEVLYEAEREQDEARLAKQVREHIDRYDQERRGQRSVDKQAHRDRCLDMRSAW